MLVIILMILGINQFKLSTFPKKPEGIRTSLVPRSRKLANLTKLNLLHKLLGTCCQLMLLKAINSSQRNLYLYCPVVLQIT